MNKAEVIHWGARYDKEEPLYNTGLEEELGQKFRENGYATKQDLQSIIKWKFQGRLLGRQKRMLNLLATVPEEDIIQMTRAVFGMNDDKLRVRLLCAMDGIGYALASVILTFFDPEHFGIFDIHAWRALFGKEPGTLFTNQRHVLEFFNALRSLSSEIGCSCRAIEKALFKKDLEESKKASGTVKEK